MLKKYMWQLRIEIKDYAHLYLREHDGVQFVMYQSINQSINDRIIISSAGGHSPLHSVKLSIHHLLNVILTSELAPNLKQI